MSGNKIAPAQSSNTPPAWTSHSNSLQEVRNISGDDIRVANSSESVSLIEPIQQNLPNGSIQSEIQQNYSNNDSFEVDEHKIFDYLATTSRNNDYDDINYEHLSRLLETDNDINATTHGGLTCLHQAAQQFPAELAEWLIKHGAKIDTKDENGWIPLHWACVENRPDMVNCLVKHDFSSLSIITSMQQTVLHLAALSDATKVIRNLISLKKQHLIEHGLTEDNFFKDWIEMKDYQGRTALHLAAQYDRTLAVRYLLEYSIPAKVATFDTSNESALVHMVEKMGPVSKLALEQLHITDTIARKHTFQLKHCEKRECNENIMTPFEVIVEYKKYDLLLHPVMAKILQLKWNKFGRWFAISQLLFYLIFLLLWSVFTIYPNKEAKYFYDMPRDIWRILLTFLCIGFFIFQLGEEFFEIISELLKQRKYRRNTRQIFELDIQNFPTYLNTEREYILGQLTELSKWKNPYTGDFWNYIDWLSYVMMLASLLSHLVDVIWHSAQAADWHARINTITLIIIWFRTLKYLRAFEFMGWFVIIIIYLKKDIIRFFIFIIVIFIPYCISVWVLFGNKGNNSTALLTPYDTFFSVFLMILVDDYPYDAMRELDIGMSFIIVGSYLTLVSIISLNLFIALLANTFQTIYDNSLANAAMERARFILSCERKLPYKLLQPYYNYITQYCNPLKETYDDDQDYLSTEFRTQLATKTILSSVQRLETLIAGDHHSDSVSSFDVTQKGSISKANSNRFEEILYSHGAQLSLISASIHDLTNSVQQLQARLRFQAPVLPPISQIPVTPLLTISGDDVKPEDD